MMGKAIPLQIFSNITPSRFDELSDHLRTQDTNGLIRIGNNFLEESVTIRERYIPCMNST